MGIARNTLKKYVASIQSFHIEYPDKKEDIDCFLKTLQLEHCGRNTDHFLQDQFISAANGIMEGGTRKAEWLKYRASTREGYKYSRFCSLFAEWCKANHQVLPRSSRRPLQISDKDRDVFLRWRRSNNRRKWTQALVFLELAKGATINSLSRKLGTSRRRIQKWLVLYKQGGVSNLEKKPRNVNDAIRKGIETKKENLIKLLHETPQLHGINRAAWGIKSLAEAYCRAYGSPIGKSTVSAYIRQQGFAFRKARKVLTSPDPLYREKMANITSILCNLAQMAKKQRKIDLYSRSGIVHQSGTTGRSANYILERSEDERPLNDRNAH